MQFKIFIAKKVSPINQVLIKMTQTLLVLILNMNHIYFERHIHVKTWNNSGQMGNSQVTVPSITLILIKDEFRGQ